MNDFVVRIDNTKLNAKQSAAIAAAIQGAVLQQLGHLDLAHATTEHAAIPGGGLGSIISQPGWRGIWIRSLRDLQNPVQPNLVVSESRE